MEENQRRREELAFSLERLAGIESKQAHAKLRRERMAAELAAMMGRGGAAVRPPREEAEDIRRQWEIIGPVPEDARARLEERFAQAWRIVAGGWPRRE